MKALNSLNKNTVLVALIVLNTLLLGVIVGRYMQPNAAMAQGARPGDYTMIPADFPGAQTGAIVIIDNDSGDMSTIMTDESQRRMVALPRMNVARLFDRASNRR